MSSNAATVAYLILATFLGGRHARGGRDGGGRRAERGRLYSLSGVAPGAAARGARWLTRFGGVGTHYRPRDRM